MAYNLKTWRDRIAQRADLTTQVVHLTRERGDTKVAKVLYEMVSSRVLRGSSTSSGFIYGNKRAVCFQDAPLVSVCQNVYYEQKYQERNPSAKTRYRACGLSLSKTYAFKKVARPVIYDKTADAKAYLPADQWWRIVSFDWGSDDTLIDWTHEREWRVPGDFVFELSAATLLFVNDEIYRAFVKLDDADGIDVLNQVKGVAVMSNLLF